MFIFTLGHVQDQDHLNEEGEDLHPAANPGKEPVVQKKEDRNRRIERSLLTNYLHLLVDLEKDRSPTMHRKKDLVPDQEVDQDQDHETMTTKTNKLNTCSPPVGYNRHTMRRYQ
jgi:hypothetical protein